MTEFIQISTTFSILALTIIKTITKGNKIKTIIKRIFKVNSSLKQAQRYLQYDYNIRIYISIL